MPTSKASEAQGVASQSNSLVTGWTAAAPQNIAANTIYPMICQAQPQQAPNSTLANQAYYWVAPYPGKLISVGIVGISTPGTVSNGAVCELIRNNVLNGGGFNVNSQSAKAGAILNIPFVAGDYFGIRYACPFSGTLYLSGTLLVQLTLPT